MKFLLTVECINAAFEEEPCTELARILKELAAKVECWPGYDEGDPLASSVIRVHDINGNPVGRAHFADL